jgi:hypothetical protein
VTLDVYQVRLPRGHIQSEDSNQLSGEQQVGRYNNRGNGVDLSRTEQTALKHLTLGDVARMAARREIDGWYVAPWETKWTIGRKSGADYLPIMLGANAMTFDTMAVAEKYLRALLMPTGVEQTSAAPLNLTIMLAQAPLMSN